MVPEDLATGEPGTESFPPFSTRLFSLVLRMLVLRMIDWKKSAIYGCHTPSARVEVLSFPVVL